MRSTPPVLPGVFLLAVLWAWPMPASAGDRVAGASTDPLTIEVQVGPTQGTPSSKRSVSFVSSPRQKARLYDVQDRREHIVRGLPLRAFLELVGPPKAADTVLLLYTDGMQILVHLADRATVDALFVAFEEGDAMERFTSGYTLHGWGTQLPGPKVIYSRQPAGKYTIWRYPTQLTGIQLVTWKLHEAALAQPTRKLPDRSGWPLYLQHCQPCHGVGGQGATRGPDFLGNMEAYRKVPAHAETGWNEHPSLHEKIKGNVEGTMPVLDQVSNQDITKLWRWLQAVHQSATK